MFRGKTKAGRESCKVFYEVYLVPIFKHAWEDLRPLLGSPWSVVIAVCSFGCTMLVRFWIIRSPSTEVGTSQLVDYIIDGLVGVAGVVGAFIVIFLFLMWVAPLRIHYAKLRAGCPDYWLHRTAEQDTACLQQSVVIDPHQVEMRDSSKTGPLLRFNFRIFNGSVFCLKCKGIAGETPVLHDYDLQEQIPLPKPELASKLFHDMHHADSGEVSVQIKFTEELIDRVYEIADRQTDNHNSGRFDLRNVLIEVTAKESKETHRLALPSVDMGTAKRIGLEHSMSVLKGKNDD